MASARLIRPEGGRRDELAQHMGEVVAAQRHRGAGQVGDAAASGAGGALERAAAIASLVEQTVRACGQAGPVLGTAAQSGGDLISQYERLRHVLADIPVDEQYAPLAQEIATLLRYHQWLVHTSLELAFARNPDPRVEAMRLRLNGLGAPAQRRLDDIRIEVSRLLAACEPTPASEAVAGQNLDSRGPSRPSRAKGV